MNATQQEALVNAWNELVANYNDWDVPDRDVPSTRQETGVHPAAIGRIESSSYELFIRILDYIEVDRDGTMGCVGLIK